MKYKVEIKGIYGTDFEIEADSEEEASDRAMELFEALNDICGNDMYYDIENVEEIED